MEGLKQNAFLPSLLDQLTRINLLGIDGIRHIETDAALASQRVIVINKLHSDLA